MRTIVVLPAPLGPSKAKIVLSATVRSTSSSTSWSPYDFAHVARPDGGASACGDAVISPVSRDSVRRRVAHRPCAALRDALSIPVRAGEVARPRSRRTPHTPTAPRDVPATHRPGLRDLPRQIGLLLVLDTSKPNACPVRSMHSVHPLAGRARAVNQPEVLKVFTAPVIALRLASRASAVFAIVCSLGSHSDR